VDWMVAARPVAMQWLGPVNVTVRGSAGVRHRVAPTPRVSDEAQPESNRCGSYQAWKV
jgi:hypothetical protein